MKRVTAASEEHWQGDIPGRRIPLYQDWGGLSA
jgi:hypothetical protein